MSASPAGSFDHVRRNRAAWDDWAAGFVAPGERSWASPEPSWGIWSVPESQLHVLPADLRGKDAIELGCGTAYISSWLARRGARPVGIDLSTEQLATARRLRAEHGMSFPLVHGNAESLPFKDEVFDLAISEYGASIWADPHRWIPEASRVLREGGELIFLVGGTLMLVCTPADGSRPTETLSRDYFGMKRFEWPDWPSVEFHLGYGDMIRLLRENGFDVEDLLEVQPAADAVAVFHSEDTASLEWSRRWPCEEIWKARKRR